MIIGKNSLIIDLIVEDSFEILIYNLKKADLTCFLIKLY